MKTLLYRRMSGVKCHVEFKDKYTQFYLFGISENWYRIIFQFPKLQFFFVGTVNHLSKV